jgi:hypothetical protein
MQSKGTALFDSALLFNTAKTLWIDFGNPCGRPNPCLDCQVPVKPLSGDVPLCFTFALV